MILLFRLNLAQPRWYHLNFSAIVDVTIATAYTALFLATRGWKVYGRRRTSYNVKPCVSVNYIRQVSGKT